MKQIIIVIALSAFFAGQSKAYTVTAKQGHKYAFYNCNQSLVRYELEIEIKGKDFYGYAAATAFFDNNTSKEVRLYASPNYTRLYQSANFIAPKGRKITRVKIAASGETRTIIENIGLPGASRTIIKTIIAKGMATTTW